MRKAALKATILTHHDSTPDIGTAFCLLTSILRELSEEVVSWRDRVVHMVSANSSTTRCGTGRLATRAGVNRSRASRRASGAAAVRRSWPPKLHNATAPLASTTNVAHARGNDSKARSAPG